MTVTQSTMPAVEGQQSPPVVTISGQTSGATPMNDRGSGKRSVKGLYVTAMMQIVVGLATIFFGIIHLLLLAPLAHTGCPIWSGVLFFVIPGIIGVAAACKRDRCTITAYMVLSILGSVVAFGVVLIVVAVSMGSDWRVCNYYYSSDYGFAPRVNCLSSRVVRHAVGIILCLLASIDGVVAIVAAAMSCGSVCCCRGKQSASQPSATAYYYHHGAQMIVNLPQQDGMITSYSNPAPYEQSFHDGRVDYPTGGAGAAANAPEAEKKDADAFNFVEPYPGTPG